MRSLKAVFKWNGDLLMVNTPRIDPDAPSIRGLLDDSQEYEIEIVGDEGGWEHTRIRANHHTFTDGVLEFWQVVDNVFHLVRGLPSGHYGSYRIVDRETTAALKREIISEIEKHMSTAMASQADDGVVDIEPEDLAELPHDPKARQIWQENLRHQVCEDLHDGKFPEVGVSHHKQLHDVWEGQGDPDPDGFGLVTRAHEGLEHRETLEDLNDEQRAYWPTGSGPEELSRWLRAREAEDEARLDRLRVEADAARDEAVLPSLPAHLNPEVPNSGENYGGLPTPPYGDTHPVYTAMVGTDGVPLKRTDADGDLIETPPAVAAYAAKVAAAPDPFAPVEPWHGKAQETP
jgi:hypothetical protein